MDGDANRDWIDPRLTAADVAFKAGDVNQAFHMALAVVTESVDNLVAGLMALVGYSAERKDWERALQDVIWLKSLPVGDPDYQALVASNAAWVLGHLGRNEESLEEARASMEYAADRPLDPRLLLNLSFAYANVGDRERALELIMTAADLDPADADIAYDKACHLAALGRSAESLEVLEAALRMDPKTAEAALYDDDFGSIRNSPEYRTRFDELIAHHRTWGPS
jgi:tetratricopeptide (TPR) repeat protein